MSRFWNFILMVICFATTGLDIGLAIIGKNILLDTSMAGVMLCLGITYLIDYIKNE